MLAIFEATGYIKHKAMVATTYGAGLRISEVCALRKSDIDSQRMRIYVRQGKGKKDRFALLSPFGDRAFPHPPSSAAPPGEQEKKSE